MPNIDHIYYQALPKGPSIWVSNSDSNTNNPFAIVYKEGGFGSLKLMTSDSLAWPQPFWKAIDYGHFQRGSGNGKTAVSTAATAPNWYIVDFILPILWAVPRQCFRGIVKLSWIKELGSSSSSRIRHGIELSATFQANVHAFTWRAESKSFACLTEEANMASHGTVYVEHTEIK